MDLFDNKKIKPMLLKETKKPFNSKDYLFEVKFDGIRAIMYINNQEIIIINRYGKIINKIFPELLKFKLKTNESCIFDGEIIIMDEGSPSFKKVQERINLKDENKIEHLSKNCPATFVVFDILYKNKDLTNLPLIERKKILNKYTDNDFFIKSRVVEEDGKTLFKTIKKHKLEGIVAKKKDSTYKIGKRSYEWLKIKNWKEESFYICGYKEEDYVASILLGKKENNKLKFVSKVVLGKNTKEFKLIKSLTKTKNSFVNFKDENYTFIKPLYEANIMYLEKTKNGHLRQPIFKEIIKNLQ